MIVLAGDVGGTNTRLALIEWKRTAAYVAAQITLQSRAIDGLAATIREFLAGQPRPSRACIGIAGPVIDGTVRTSNLPWFIDQRVLAAEIGIPETTLVNDFAALGESLRFLDVTDFESLQEGVAEAGGPITLVGAGTGLGVALLFEENGRYRTRGSEGGHAAFGARTEREWEICRALSRRYGVVPWEKVVSGPGLAAVYQHLTASSQPLEPAEITRRGLTRTDPAAVETLSVFAGAYGAVAGNLALTTLCTGGLYLAGGIAPRLIDKLRDGDFMTAFGDRGELAPLLKRIPVRVIMNPNAGLIGAAASAAGLGANRSVPVSQAN